MSSTTTRTPEIKVSTLRTNPKNPRTIRDTQFFRLVASIRDFPKMMKLRPMVFDRQNMWPLGGNQRLSAIKHLKMETIPADWIVFADDLTEDEKQEFLIKDNVNFGDWDTDMLANEWNLDSLNAWGLEIKGTKDTQRLQEDDYTPEIHDEYKPVSKMGDLFTLNDHRIMCGDSGNQEHVDKLMNGHKADMVWTDPPYNVDYQGTGKNTKTKILGDNSTTEQFQKDLNAWFTNYQRHTKEGAPFYVCHASRTASQFELAMEMIGLKIKAQIIWNKAMANMGWSDYRWKHEPIFYATYGGKNTNFYGDRTNVTVWNESWDQARIEKELKAMAKKQESGGSTIWTVGRDTHYIHPTQKPLELIGIAIRNSSKKGDMIMDLFEGSGSALMACEQTSRTHYGMEKDTRWIDNIIRRWYSYQKQNDRPIKITRNGKDITNEKWIAGK